MSIAPAAMPPCSSFSSFLIVPFASGPWGDHAGGSPINTFSTLSLPHLKRLFRYQSDEAHLEGSAFDFLLPHKKYLKHQRAQTCTTANEPCACLTLCHWRVGIDDICMLPPADLALSAQECDVLMEAMRPYFAEEDIGIAVDPQGQVVLTGPVVAQWIEQGQLACVERVVGRHVRPWLPLMQTKGDAACTLLRLQNEMQMLLYTHPVNAHRQAQGALAVNSFWVSELIDLSDFPTHTLTPVLSTPALQGDWQGWARAWQRLDSSGLAAACKAVEAGEVFDLLLCGERHAHRYTFSLQSQGLTCLLRSRSKRVWQRARTWLSGIGASSSWEATVLADL